MALFYWCSICGRLVGGEQHWSNEFRGVCINSEDQIAITGVGFYSAGQVKFNAPVDPLSRYDDPNYVAASPDNALGVMNQISRNGRWAFIFHDACWKILCDSKPPISDIDLPHLFDIFSSFPTIDGQLAVGNYYLVPKVPSFYTRASDELGPVGKVCPSMPPEYFARLVSTANFRKIPLPVLDDDGERLMKKSNNQGFLGGLPEELLLMISKLLPTADVFNARLASRAFWSSFHSRSFWVSRFSPGGERAWLYEICQSPQYTATDLQIIYRRTSIAQLDSDLENRRRICNLVGKLQEILELRWEVSTEHLESSSLDTVGWKVMEVDVRPIFDSCKATDANRVFREGCRALREVRYELPSPWVSSFIFFFSTVGGMRFVSGMHVFTADAVGLLSTCIKLGYRSSAYQSYHLPRGSILLGFGVAALPMGIRGIQVHYLDSYSNAEKISQWYGISDGCDHSLQAVNSRRVSAIRAAFDGCKMVSIGVGGVEPFNGSRALTSRPLSLRQRAMWYPCVPGPDLLLNGMYAFASDACQKQFRSIFWTSFGGTGGNLLSYVTSINVVVLEHIYGIKFTYEEDISEEDGCPGYLGMNRDDRFIPRASSFPIDGYAGERLNSVTVKLDYEARYPGSDARHPNVKGMKIATNHCRSHVFMESEWEDDYRDIVLLPEPGATIIGFFAHKAGAPCLSDIGIISERIRGPIRQIPIFH